MIILKPFKIAVNYKSYNFLQSRNSKHVNAATVVLRYQIPPTRRKLLKREMWALHLTKYWKVENSQIQNPYGFLMTSTAITKLANVMKIKQQINGNRKQRNPLERCNKTPFELQKEEESRREFSTWIIFNWNLSNLQLECNLSSSSSLPLFPQIKQDSFNRKHN